MTHMKTWTALLILLGALAGFALSIKPWELLREEQAQARTAKLEMKQTEKERAELLRQQSKLDSPVGREELVRKRGYKRPDETPWETP